MEDYIAKKLLQDKEQILRELKAKAEDYNMDTKNFPHGQRMVSDDVKINTGLELKDYLTMTPPQVHSILSYFETIKKFAA